MASISKRITTSAHKDSHMHKTWIVMSLLVAAISICTANAVASSTAASPDQKSTSLGTASAAGTSTQSAPATPHHLAHGHTKDDIYIDDEGSGGHGGHRDDIEGEPDYSGSGFGPDDEDSVTHSRQNNHNKNSNRHSTIGGNTGVGSSSGKGAQGAKNNNNQSSGSGGFAGSGDGGFGDIRGENDDDEDKPFRGHTVQVPSGGYRPAVHSVTANDDLEIEEDPVDNTGLTEDDNGEEEDEDDEEDVDVDEGPLDEDLNGHGDGNLDKDFGVNKTPFAPTTTDDEDLEIDADGDETIQRGLDKHPDDKDSTRLGVGAGGTTSSGGATDKGNEVFIMNAKNDDRTTSFFSQPGILAAVIGGAVVGLLCAILVVMFIVYRMRKKDEGSYALDEPKRSPAVNSYAKNTNNREFYA